MICVGGSVAVSSVLSGQPMLTAEAVRYALACALLVALARLAGRPILLPRGAEWIWLSGIAGAGLVLFNVALVQGSRQIWRNRAFVIRMGNYNEDVGFVAFVGAGECSWRRGILREKRQSKRATV